MKHQLVLLLLVVATTASCTSAQQSSVGTAAGRAAPEVVATAAAAPTAVAAAADGGESQAAAAASLPTPTSDAAPQAAADIDNLTVTLEPIVDGLDIPVFVTHAGDGSGRLFIVEKTGAIRILLDGELLEQPFLDLRGQVSLSNEQGLLGLAFAPDYDASGLFYINYTDKAGDTVVARYRVAADDPNRADPASATSLLTIDQPAANHNGGMLAFGPDGFLYIGMGDGGAANDRFGNGQNPATLLGKMLRIDVSNPAAGATYGIPADNPWVDQLWNGQEMRAEVWALGLRNPWRFSFDRTTGDLWIGDVGQNEYEEVNYTPLGRSGLNYGWPIMEASHCFQATTCDQTGLELPVAEYTHAGHCSVTGGYVYRGQANPGWDGVYFFGDYCSGDLWALTADAAGSWRTGQVAATGRSLTSFGEDEAGELYVTTMDGGLYRMAQ